MSEGVLNIENIY